MNIFDFLFIFVIFLYSFKTWERCKRLEDKIDDLRQVLDFLVSKSVDN